jgi:hypothetical protein
VADPVVLIADLFPGVVLDTETNARIDGVPKGAKLHVIVSTKEIAIGWDAGTVNGVATVNELRVDISEFDIEQLDHSGGTVGPYTIKRAGGCSCGAALKRWNPYAGQPLTQLARPARDSSYGLPQRYARTR